MKIFLETNRLILQQFTTTDADRLCQLDSDPDVTRYTHPTLVYGQPQPKLEIIQDKILPKWLAYYETNYGIWAAIEKSNQAFIGWFCLRPALDYRFAAEAGLGDRELELGYRLQKLAWGRGYATEVSQALIAKGFSDPTIDRIVAVALSANRASIRVMEKAGLQFETTWIYPPTNQEAVQYALSRDSFASNSG
jgi:[ribosomal protein S5]-alanine N-acetyltransferase